MVFWSRWHVTLCEWLKTYVYNPLVIALMRRYHTSSMVPYLSVFAILFFLMGVWDGQTSQFLFFGVLQGAGVAAVQLRCSSTNIADPKGGLTAVQKFIQPSGNHSVFARPYVYLFSRYATLVLV